MYNKIKSFTQFLNEFELEGEHQKELKGIMPFSSEDMNEVNNIIKKFDSSLIVKKYEKFMDNIVDDFSNNPDRYIDGVDIGISYIETPKVSLNFNYHGFNSFPREYKGMQLYEGVTLLFSDLDTNHSNIFNDDLFNIDMAVWNYGNLPNEKPLSTNNHTFNQVSGIITSDDRNIGDIHLYSAIVFHSIKEFQMFMNLMIEELENKYKKFTETVNDFIKQYCLK